MANLLLEPIDWKIEEGPFFVVRRHLDAAGSAYAEYTSRTTVGSWPLVHITIGRNPETGRRKVARGLIAIGRFAVGFVSFGQVAVGVISLGQASFGAFALGQLALSATLTVGQLAVAPVFALGQVAVAYTAIGQIAVGEYALGQGAFGPHPWTPEERDPAAQAYFEGLGILHPG